MVVLFSLVVYPTGSIHCNVKFKTKMQLTIGLVFSGEKLYTCDFANEYVNQRYIC